MSSAPHLQYAVHDKPLALQLHLWFAHGEADLQLQAILCRTEGGAMAEVYLRLGQDIIVKLPTILSHVNIRWCRLIGCPPDQNLQTGTSDVLHCSSICWWETLYLGWIFFLLNIEHLRSARDVIPLPPYSFDRKERPSSIHASSSAT